jgi:hypothetical protein
MNSPFGWLLPALAVVATGIAIWADDNFTLAVPAAVAAVLAAALLFVEAVLARSRSTRPSEWGTTETEAGTMRAAFRSGRLGREAVVDLLDRLERDGPNPNLPARRIEETRELVRMSSRDFRNYLRQRLESLESRS